MITGSGEGDTKVYHPLFSFINIGESCRYKEILRFPVICDSLHPFSVPLDLTPSV